MDASSHQPVTKHVPDETGYSWCLHCERTYPANAYREIAYDGDDPLCFGETLFLCHYADCDGSEVDDWEWGKVRDNNPEYPEVPEVGKVYPLHPSET